MNDIFEKIVGGIFIALGFFVAFFLLSLLGALPVMLLWNAVAVPVLGLKVVTFWQAWGLMMLASMLFKSTGPTTKSN